MASDALQLQLEGLDFGGTGDGLPNEELLVAGVEDGLGLEAGGGGELDVVLVGEVGQDDDLGWDDHVLAGQVEAVGLGHGLVVGLEAVELGLELTDAGFALRGGQGQLGQLLDLGDLLLLLADGLDVVLEVGEGLGVTDDFDEDEGLAVGGQVSTWTVLLASAGLPASAALGATGTAAAAGLASSAKAVRASRDRSSGVVFIREL